MPYVPGTHYLTLLRHHLALIYLKRLYVIIYSYCCACTMLFFTSGYVLELAPLLLFMYPMFFGINYYIQKKENTYSSLASLLRVRFAVLLISSHVANLFFLFLASRLCCSDANFNAHFILRDYGAFS